MTDAIGAATAVSEGAGIAGPETDTLKASDITNATQERRGENFSNMAGEAFKTGLKPFGQGNPIDDQRNALVQGTTGTVGAEKSSVLSEVARPGVEAPNATPEDPTTDMIDRLNHLYMDIAVHHVAWGVAIKVQKDMSQLLRGS